MRETLDFSQTTDPADATLDNGGTNATSIKRINNGEKLHQDVLRRPAENLRRRTEVLRDTVNNLLYLSNADRALLLDVTDKTKLLTWSGLVNGGPPASGTLTGTSGGALVFKPFLTPGDASGSTPAKARLVEGNFEMGFVVDSATTRSYAGANDIRFVFKRGNATGGAVVVTDNGDGTGKHAVVTVDDDVTINGTNDFKTAFDAETWCVTLGITVDDVEDDSSPSTLFYVAFDLPASPNVSDPLYFSGALDAEVHILPYLELAAFFATSANELKEGDTLAIWYDAINDGAGGGRRESLDESPESNANLDATSLFNTSVEPAKAVNGIPICKVSNGDLVFINGFKLPSTASTLSLTQNQPATTTMLGTVVLNATPGSASMPKVVTIKANGAAEVVGSGNATALTVTALGSAGPTAISATGSSAMGGGGSGVVGQGGNVTAGLSAQTAGSGLRGTGGSAGSGNFGGPGLYGKGGAGAAGDGPGALLEPATAAGVGVAVQGVASQTGDLQQWRSSGGTVLARMNSDGHLVHQTVVGNVPGFDALTVEGLNDGTGTGQGDTAIVAAGGAGGSTSGNGGTGTFSIGGIAHGASNAGGDGIIGEGGNSGASGAGSAGVHGIASNTGVFSKGVFGEAGVSGASAVVGQSDSGAVAVHGIADGNGSIAGMFHANNNGAAVGIRNDGTGNAITVLDASAANSDIQIPTHSRFKYGAARNGVLVLPAFHFKYLGSAFTSGTGYIELDTTDALYGTTHLPRGSVITAVKARTAQGGTPDLQLQLVAHDLTGAVAGAVTCTASTSSGGPTTVTLTPGSSLATFSALLHGSVDMLYGASAIHQIYALVIEYTYTNADPNAI